MLLLPLLPPTAHAPLAQLEPDGPMGYGKLDNVILSSTVHNWWGLVVCGLLVAITVLLVVRWRKEEPLGRNGRILLVATQVALMIQALLGIKLLDQMRGYFQLYIHYIGGLIPLGLFIIVGWLTFRSEQRRVQTLAVAAAIGAVSAVMAYGIGQWYVSQTAV